MNFWKNVGTNVHIAMKVSGAVWMEVVIRGYMMITRILSTDCKTTLAMNAQIMSVLIFVSSSVRIVRKVIARTVRLSQSVAIAIQLNFANHAERFQLVNVVDVTRVTLVFPWVDGISKFASRNDARNVVVGRLYLCFANKVHDADE